MCKNTEQNYVDLAFADLVKYTQHSTIKKTDSIHRLQSSHSCRVEKQTKSDVQSYRKNWVYVNQL